MFNYLIKYAIQKYILQVVGKVYYQEYIVHIPLS